MNSIVGIILYHFYEQEKSELADSEVGNGCSKKRQENQNLLNRTD